MRCSVGSELYLVVQLVTDGVLPLQMSSPSACGPLHLGELLRSAVLLEWVLTVLGWTPEQTSCRTARRLRRIR